jgi:hypothetical protein
VKKDARLKGCLSVTEDECAIAYRHSLESTHVVAALQVGAFFPHHANKPTSFAFHTFVISFLGLYKKHGQNYLGLTLQESLTFFGKLVMLKEDSST